MCAWLRRFALQWLLYLVAPFVHAAYRALFLLRLGLLLAEKELMRSDVHAMMGDGHGAAVAGAGGEEERAAQARMDDASAWIDFCEWLKAAGELVVRLPDTPGVELTALDRTEGVRYLSRLVRGGVEAFVDGADPAFPVMRPLPYNVKMGADNPDNLYQYATVSGSFSYRITGTRGTVPYLSFGCYAGSRPGQGSNRPGHIDSSQLRLGDGHASPYASIEIIVSCEPPADTNANWLRMEPDSTRLVVRQTFLDRSTEAPAQLRIERVAMGPGGEGGGASDVPKPPLAARDVAAGLAGAAMFVSGAADQFLQWSNMFSARARNAFLVLDNDTSMTAWADPSIFFLHGYWALAPGEALLIQVTPPECVYFNFQLNNWWMESMDDANRRVHVNKHTAVPRSGSGEGGPGEIAIVVCAVDPALPGVNWIDTCWHSHGTMAWRWVLADHHPVPSCRVVPAAQLAAALGME
ncbi:hypothetical protein FOA52_004783 [Chlamydomonas sp. UWO 241]|nr:hypothetical protein FOA52_004783 [Chlamydomonas sp. UWO 241]